MFYDERINSEQGRAYRAATLFALIILILYGILHGFLLSAHGSFHVALMSVEIFCGIGGALLIAFGELKYGICPADEMVDAQKKRYYSKAFFGFLYMLIAVYCCIRVPFSIHLNAYDVAPNHLIILLALSVWLVLLFRFKRNEIPLNSSFIEVSPSEYWKHVLKNVGKLGGITALFTAISAVNTVMLTKDAFDFLSVLLAGSITFVSFAVEYLIFSLAERSSDKAKEKGKISGATLIFAAVTAAAYLLYAAISTYVVINAGDINSSAAILKINSLQQYFDCVIFYFSGLFSIYLYSELKVLKNDGTRKAITLFISSHLVSFCFGQISRVSSPFISEILDNDPAMINAWLFFLELLNAAVLGIYIVSLIIFIKALISLGLTSKKAYLYPTAFVVLKIVNLILASQHRLANINAFIESFGAFLLYGILLLFLCERRRKAEDIISETYDNLD